MEHGFSYSKNLYSVKLEFSVNSNCSTYLRKKAGILYEILEVYRA